MKAKTKSFIARLDRIFETYLNLSPAKQKDCLAVIKEQMETLENDTAKNIAAEIYKLLDENKKEKAK